MTTVIYFFIFYLRKLDCKKMYIYPKISYINHQLQFKEFINQMLRKKKLIKSIKNGLIEKADYLFVNNRRKY